MFKRFLFAVAGLLLVAYGLKGPMLSVAGADALGTVTGIKTGQESSRSSALTTRDYEIHYRFVSSDGTVTAGVAYRADGYTIASLPATGSTIAVKYLKSLPVVNLPSLDTQPNLVAFGAAGFGLVLAVVGALGIGLQRRP